MPPSINIETHCIDLWPRPFTRNRQRSKFKARYSDTLDLLESELWKVGAKNVVIQLALTRDQIRLDGKPRADARPSHPGVILSFETHRGSTRSSTQMPCDRFDDWQDNVRALALTLEHLRAVDRYGVTTNGEQYAGWTRLGNGESASGESKRFSSREAAESFLTRVLGADVKSWSRSSLRRDVEKKSHPDTGGSDEMFKAAREALEMLGV